MRSHTFPPLALLLLRFVSVRRVPGRDWPTVGRVAVALARKEPIMKLANTDLIPAVSRFVSPRAPLTWQVVVANVLLTLALSGCTFSQVRPIAVAPAPTDVPV